MEKMDKKIDLSGFKMRDTLNPKVWDGEKMKSDVRKMLLQIADDYFEGLALTGVDIEDITLTGSLANYNWSKYSDVDLHIVVDYGDIDIGDEIITDFLKARSGGWNEAHDIKIYGFDVEIYVQDMGEEHTSTGIYSILNNDWVIEPEPQTVKIDKEGVTRKSTKIMNAVENLYDDIHDDRDYEGIVTKADKIQDKIKKMRQCGLDEEGEFSVENMVFKVLRRNGTLERLSDIKTLAYDKSVTLEGVTGNNTYL